MSSITHTQVTAPVTLVTTAETVVCVSQAPSNLYSNKNMIWGHVNVTEGTGGTGFQVRVRQGTTTAGALIFGPELDSLAAANQETAPFGCEDTNPAGGAVDQPGAGQYCVTVQQVAATANGTAVGDIFVASGL